MAQTISSVFHLPNILLSLSGIDLQLANRTGRLHMQSHEVRQLKPSKASA